MIQPLQAQIETFFDRLLAHRAYPAFASQVAEQGHARVAHLLRAVARSEEIRIQMMRRQLITCAEESDLIQVCPHCGLVINGDLPECCPVDGIPASQFEKVE